MTPEEAAAEAEANARRRRRQRIIQQQQAEIALFFNVQAQDFEQVVEYVLQTPVHTHKQHLTPPTHRQRNKRAARTIQRAYRSQWQPKQEQRRQQRSHSSSASSVHAQGETLRDLSSPARGQHSGEGAAIGDDELTPKPRLSSHQGSHDAWASDAAVRAVMPFDSVAGSNESVQRMEEESEAAASRRVEVDMARLEELRAEMEHRAQERVSSHHTLSVPSFA